jgi:hypothetical protein
MRNMGLHNDVCKRLLRWCPKPENPIVTALRQHSRPIGVFVTVTVLLTSFLLASHFMAYTAAPPPTVPVPTSTPQPQTTPAPEATSPPEPSPSPSLAISSESASVEIEKAAMGSESMDLNWDAEDDDIDEVYSILPASDGGVILAGYTKSSGAGGSDVWLVKTYLRLIHWAAFEFAGIQVPERYEYEHWIDWKRTYGGALDDGAKCLVQITGNVPGYALAGYTESYGAGGSDMFMVRTNLNGDLKWKTTYGGLQDDGANGIVESGDGGFVLAGFTNSGVSLQSTWVVKIDAYGNMQWSVVCPGEGASSVVRTVDGGYALTVEFPNAFGLVKLDSYGQLQWNQTYAGSSDDARAESLVQTVDGGYALVGWTLDNVTGVYSGWLVKTDASGNVQWSHTYEGYGMYSVVQTSEGGYAMAGDYVCLIVTDSSGNELWIREYGEGIEVGGEWHYWSGDISLIDSRAYAIVEPAPNQFHMAAVRVESEDIAKVDEGLHSMYVRIVL